MSHPVAINHSQAIKLISAQSEGITLATETVPLADAVGRVLADAIIAPHDVPEFDCSRMDGYAINTTALQMAQEGCQSGFVLDVGKAVHATAQNHIGHCGSSAIPVMTGAVLPEDADAIIIKEQVQTKEAQIYFEQLPQKRQYFRTAGSDMKAGQTVIKSYQKITAAHVGLLASLGLVSVQVFRKVRVALMASGDELIAPGETCKIGQIYDANSVMLEQLLLSMGCDVELFDPVNDVENAIQERFEQLLHGAFDLVVTVGGVSMGDKDLIPLLLNDLGTVIFHKVRVKPGFPLLFGKLGHSLFFGLPGNPVSAYSTLCQYVFTAIKMLNQQPLHERTWRAELLHDWEKTHLRREYLRGYFEVVASGCVQVRVCGQQQSSRIESLTEANCFIVLDESQQALHAGDSVNIQPFSQFNT